jgi:hypothetical protein
MALGSSKRFLHVGKAAAAILLVVNLTKIAAAMDISIERLPNGFRSVLAKGTIVGGDANRLRAVFRLADRDEHGHKSLTLASPGGEVQEALATVALMDQEEVSTFVMPDTDCASACAQILFVSGIYRAVFDGGRLGLHSCSLGGTRDNLCNEKIAQNAIAHGVPWGAVMASMQYVDPSGLQTFDALQADCWGLTKWPPEYRRPMGRNGIPACITMMDQCGMLRQLPTQSSKVCFGQKYNGFVKMHNDWVKTQTRTTQP